MTSFPQNAKLFATFTAAISLAVLTGCGDKTSPKEGHAPNNTAAHKSHDAHSFSDSVAINNLTISKGWVRAIPATAKTTAAYFMIENHGDSVDTLIELQSEAAEFVELHETSKDDDGTMLMRRVPALALPAGGTVMLKPGSYHVMMINPATRFSEGDMIPITLSFENAGTIDITLPAVSASVHTSAEDHAGKH